MFITNPAWKIDGVPQSLLAPAIPWYSVLLDVSEPCFAVMPRIDSLDRENHIRLFSDIAQLMECALVSKGAVYAISGADDQLHVSKVTAIGSYPCPQTGIKLRVYFDASDQPWPAHSGQPQFSKQLSFDIEADFAGLK